MLIEFKGVGPSRVSFDVTVPMVSEHNVIAALRENGVPVRNVFVDVSRREIYDGAERAGSFEVRA